MIPEEKFKFLFSWLVDESLGMNNGKLCAQWVSTAKVTETLPEQFYRKLRNRNRRNSANRMNTVGYMLGVLSRRGLILHREMTLSRNGLSYRASEWKLKEENHGESDWFRCHYKGCTYRSRNLPWLIHHESMHRVPEAD